MESPLVRECDWSRSSRNQRYSPYSVAVGVPARVVGNRSSDLVNYTPNRKYVCKMAASSLFVQCRPAEVEKTAELSHQHLQDINDTIPIHSVFENWFIRCSSVSAKSLTPLPSCCKLRAGSSWLCALPLGLRRNCRRDRIPIGRGFAGRSSEANDRRRPVEGGGCESDSPEQGIQSMVGVPLLVKPGDWGVPRRYFSSPPIYQGRCTVTATLLTALVSDCLAPIRQGRCTATATRR